MDRPADLDALRAAYARFLGRADRVLLTGHSHQAWPDVTLEALSHFFEDSARLVDDKWDEVVFPKVERVGRAVLTRMGLPADDPIAFGRSTHELTFRLLTCLPRSGARVVTTTGEFHSLTRQLARLAEEGVAVEWVSGQPRDTLTDRLLEAIVPGVSLVAVSAVLFEDAYVLPRLGELVARAEAVGALALIDAYHAFNVVELDWGPRAASAFVTAGGYKYAGIGEGLCWMRVPRGCELRPVYTGWFADFGGLAGATSRSVGYGPGGARFAGATFDGSMFYRAEAVLDHFDRHGLDAPSLRRISTRQTRRILEGLDARGWGALVASSRQDARRGGFVAVRDPRAAAVARRLRDRGVFVDARGDLLRLGPAPYLTDEEIDRGVEAAAHELGR